MQGRANPLFFHSRNCSALQRKCCKSSIALDNSKLKTLSSLCYAWFPKCLHHSPPAYLHRLWWALLTYIAWQHQWCHERMSQGHWEPGNCCEAERAASGHPYETCSGVCAARDSLFLQHCITCAIQLLLLRLHFQGVGKRAFKKLCHCPVLLLIYEK